MRFYELRNSYRAGRIEKKLYWEIARENYTHILGSSGVMVGENHPHPQYLC